MSTTISPFEQSSGYLGQWFNICFGVIDLWLAVQMMVLNVIVIAYYQPEVKKIVPFMYILLSVTDSITGLAALLNGLMFLLLEHPGSYLIGPTYLIFSITFRVSVFLNLIISIVRTINIIRPFYRIRRLRIGVAVALYSLASAAISVGLLFDHEIEFNLQKPKREYLEKLMYKPSGYQILSINGLPTITEEFRNLTLFIAVPFVLPSIVTMICMSIQIRAVLKPSPTQCSNSDKQKEITKTIIMLTVLFFFCNTVYIFYPVLYYKRYIKPDGLNTETALGLTQVEQLRLQYCLGVLCPYINAAFNPAILIYRGKELRGSVKNKVKEVMTRPVRGIATAGSALSLHPILPDSLKSFRRAKYTVSQF